jgi:hypothetical protein
MFSRELKIRHLNGRISSGLVYYEQANDAVGHWTLKFVSSVTEDFETVNADLFHCLTDLRRELATYSYIPLCNGARKNIVLSGMCGDMGGGRVGYLVEIGEGVSPDNLVDILDYVEPDLVVSVEEQESFRELWLYPNGRSTSVQKELKIIDKNREVNQGTLLIYGNLKPFKIEFMSSLTPMFICSGKDFPECLAKLWRELSSVGFTPLCNGARVDTHVFLFEKRVLRGRRTYPLVLGRMPSTDDRLLIFDYAEPSLIGSIEEQEAFYHLWLDSIKPVHGLDKRNNLEEIFFRFEKIGDLLRMWLFEIDGELESEFETALSPLSPEDVDQIGELKSEAIIGFFGKYVNPHAEGLVVNTAFVNFLHQVVASRVSLDGSFRAAADQQQDGWIYVIDERGAEDSLPEDIIGSFEVQGGQIVVNSYQPNDNYAIIGKKGLFQLTPFLSKALVDALKAL